MSSIDVESITQRIVVNPATSSVSVINAGPMGPTGPMGPSEVSTVLTVDGQMVTRASGLLVPITRANLAEDTAFRSRFMSTVVHGATAGTARSGTAPIFWVGSVNPTNATDNDQLYRTDLTAHYMRISSAWVEVGSARFQSTVVHGATAGTARSGAGPILWIGSVNPTNVTDGDELYRTDLTAKYMRISGAWVEIGSTRYVPLAGGVLLTDAAQTITTATITDITWGTEVSDPDGWTSGGIATLTVPSGKDGRYLVTYNGAWSASPGASNGVACLSTGITYESVSGATSAFTYFTPTLTFLRTFVAGNTLKFQVYQNSGSNKDIVSRLEICPV